MSERNIAGVVLAGGRSSRMGQDKALLDYKGRPLLDHMIALLEETGLSDIYVSGDFQGYNCIPDSAPHEGPARAIVDVMAALKGRYDGILFVPVDMPFLTPDVLGVLLAQDHSVHFTIHPLPFYITQFRGGEAPLPLQNSEKESVKGLLLTMDVSSTNLPLAFENCMTNTNTPEEWDKVLHA